MEPDSFITLHGCASFRHSGELIAALKAGQCALDHAPNRERSLPCSHYFHIYSVRLKHLSQFKTEHAASLIADVETLLPELDCTPEEPCGLWGFSLAPYYTFSVFEGLTTQRVLGCIRAVDRRLIDENAWERLWHD